MTLTRTVCLSEIRPSFSSVKPSISCSHFWVLSFTQILCLGPLLEPGSLSIELAYCHMLPSACLPQGWPLPAQTCAPNPSLWALFGMPQPRSILWFLIKYLTHGPWFLLTQQSVLDADFNWFFLFFIFSGSIMNSSPSSDSHWRLMFSDIHCYG